MLVDEKTNKNTNINIFNMYSLDNRKLVNSKNLPP